MLYITIKTLEVALTQGMSSQLSLGSSRWWPFAMVLGCIGKVPAKHELARLQINAIHCMFVLLDEHCGLTSG